MIFLKNLKKKKKRKKRVDEFEGCRESSNKWLGEKNE